MRILIVTLVDHSNYGNRLQNYALEHLMIQMPVDVASGLQIFSKERSIACAKTMWARRIKSILPLGLFRVLIALADHSITFGTKPEKKREARMQSFSKEYLHPLPKLYMKKDQDLEKKLADRYDYYIAGSDQVWNPIWAGQDYHFLTFAPAEKRIAFAASFGVEALEQEAAERFGRRLTDFKYISVREPSGARLVRQLTGKAADVVLDPTLLLAREEWKKLAKKPDVALPEHYVLSFFLGEEPKQALDAFAEKQGLPILHLNQEEYPDLYVLDPAEFLYVVEYADYVLTDSFHGMVFAIKFEREFYVFHRKQRGMENMFGRIGELLKWLGLSEREQQRSAVHEVPPVSGARWMEIADRLDAEREKTLETMRRVMALPEE